MQQKVVITYSEWGYFYQVGEVYLVQPHSRNPYYFSVVGDKFRVILKTHCKPQRTEKLKKLIDEL